MMTPTDAVRHDDRRDATWRDTTRHNDWRSGEADAADPHRIGGIRVVQDDVTPFLPTWRRSNPRPVRPDADRKRAKSIRPDDYDRVRMGRCCSSRRSNH